MDHLEYLYIPEGTEALMQLQTLYKQEIGENTPSPEELLMLCQAISEKKILFFGCFDKEKLVACCSVCHTFSTFNYLPCGVFEDFYILPEYRHKGIARKLARFAYDSSEVSSMIVGCADCDAEMYKAIGFNIRLGNLLAYSLPAN